MKRGEIWTIAGGADHAGKPRPAVILQNNSFDLTHSITVCIFTTDPTTAPLMRVLVAPTSSNGLLAASRLTVDKITTVPKTKLGARVGHLAESDMASLNRAILFFLDLAGRHR